MANSPLLNIMKSAVEKAGRAIARDFGEIENLQGNMNKLQVFISHAKNNAQGVLIEELDKARDNFGYESSIGNRETKSKEKWLINIIDGENNFLRAIPHWSISLALEDKDGIIAGIVYDVVRNEMYHAQKGYGAFVNSSRLKASNVREFSGSVILSSFDFLNEKSLKEKMNQDKLLYSQGVSSIKNLGNVALDICYISAQKGEVCVQNGVKSYEVAAAGAIAKEAGLFVSNLKGGKDYVYNSSVLVAPPSLHTKTLKLLNS